jgi:hypothetical protein
MIIPHYGMDGQQNGSMIFLANLIHSFYPHNFGVEVQNVKHILVDPLTHFVHQPTKWHVIVGYRILFRIGPISYYFKSQIIVIYNSFTYHLAPNRAEVTESLDANKVTFL